MIASFVVLLFILMNRVRGSGEHTIAEYWGFPTKHSGSLPASLIFSVVCTTAYAQMYSGWKTISFLFLCCAAFYKLGETFGWGKWIGQIDGGIPNPSSDEGKSTGIHYVANFIFDETKYTRAYATVALFLRGILWFALAYCPLAAIGFIPFADYCMLVLVSGACFPLSFWVSRIWKSDYYWERGETIYGLLLGLIFVFVFQLPMY